ncbi:MAG: zinc-binding dehydrogenase [Betaproteobacteria bacterium]|nr:zinc-binding dehydrogenase [Betaproteobacteria bacterium]
MRSYWIQTQGGETALEARDIPNPEPGPGQLLLRMRAAGLNRGELIVGHGLTAAGATKRLGIEGAGEVVRSGPGVSGFSAGDRLMGRIIGAFAEHALMEACDAIPVPPRLTWEEAAATPIAFMVVHDMLVAQGNLKAGEWLLVLGVTSGVGVAALQAGKALGANVMGTSGSAAKLEKLKELGLDVPLLTRKGDFHDAVRSATAGRGADLCVNTVGGTVFPEAIRALSFRGRMAIVGYVDGSLKSEIDLDAVHAKRLRIYGVSNKLRNAEQRCESVLGFIQAFLPAFADGRIRPLVDRVFDFADLAAAKAHMESNAHAGKIVVRIP